MKLLSILIVLASVAVGCGDDERPQTFGGRVAKEVVSEEVNGIQVYVVSAEDPDGVAQGCVDFYLEEYSAASCYVFASDAEFEAAGTSDEYGQGMENLCWTSYRSVSPTASNGSDDNKKYRAKRCA